MKSYLALAPKYLSAHKRKTRLTIISVVMAVTLVVGIFSMLDTLVKFERAQVLKDEGNYHILIRKPSQKEIDFIRSRIDIKNTGSLKDLGEGTINGEKCALGALDENFAKNLNFELAEGRYSIGDNEIMLEKWVMEKYKPALKIGDTVTISLSNGIVKKFVISGIYKDLGASKAASIPIVLLSMNASAQLTPKANDYFILFKDGVNVMKAEDEIKKALNIADDRIARNEGLLALMLQTKNSTALKMYAVGVILFCLVLVTAVVMIYNTFNISVMERVRQFGLLRCIGASQSQIKRLIRREGFSITLKAIPIGVLAGMLMTFICSAILKFYNNKLFADISLFSISAIGIGAGAIIGFLSVFTASLLPAKKAAKVSPVNALTGSNEIKISKRNKQGLLMKMLHAEIAIGINNAAYKKKTLFLMSSSIALSIIMFLGFNVLVNPTYLGMKAIKPYTADISLRSTQGINKDIYTKLLSSDGIKRVYGRMSSYVNATFNAARLTDTYKKEIGGVKTESNGLFVAPENSWLISYDKTQIKWAKEYLTEGEIDENKLNAQNGVIAVAKTRRNNSLTKTANLQLGDKVYIKTKTGTKEFTVMGILSSAPSEYESDNLTMTTFITTEKLFTEVTATTAYNAIDLQLNNNNQQQTVNEIKGMVDNTMTFHDIRQLNMDAKHSFMTMAVFIYGFVGVIALISILNIINTMNTSVASKTRYLGVMRAIGMSGHQLSGMVLTEAAIYSISGCFVGCILGIALQKAMAAFLIADWKFPLLQVILIFMFCMLTAALSIISPLKRIRSKGISEVIGSL